MDFGRKYDIQNAIIHTTATITVSRDTYPFCFKNTKINPEATPVDAPSNKPCTAKYIDEAVSLSSLRKAALCEGTVYVTEKNAPIENETIRLQVIAKGYKRPSGINLHNPIIPIPIEYTSRMYR